MSTPKAARQGAAALAVALPVMVLGSAFLALTAGDAYTPSERAIELDEMLAESSPDVVIIGSSVAHTAIDIEQFGPLVDDRVVVSAHMILSRQPAWYAILDNRVFSAGHRPELVVLLDSTGLFETAPLTERSEQSLLGQMDADDSLILRKTFGDDSPIARRLQSGRGAARSWVVDRLKWYSVGLLWASDGHGTLESRGRDEADAALDQVFGPDGRMVDFELHTRVLPVVVDAAQTPVGDWESATSADSYIPDLARLAREHDANFVVVRAPDAPSNAWWQPPLKDAETELITTLNKMGAGYVDLSDLPLDARDFSDRMHFSDTGRAKMTRAIASALIDLGALGDGPLVATPLPARLLSARRKGNLPGPSPVRNVKLNSNSECAAFGGAPDWGFLSTRAVRDAAIHLFSPLLLLQHGEPLTQITRLNEGCEQAAYHVSRGFLFGPRGDDTPQRGDFTVGHSPDFPITNDHGVTTYWVYPGTVAEFDVGAPEGWTGGEVEITMWLDLFGELDAPPTLSVGDASAEFELAEGLARASIIIETDDPSWTISLESLPEQAYSAVRTLSVTFDGSGFFVIGAPRFEGGFPLRLIGENQGQFETDGGDISLVYDLVPSFLPDGTGVFDVAAIEYLTPWPLSQRGVLSTFSRCSPLRLVRNGLPIAETPVVCGVEDPFLQMLAEQGFNVDAGTFEVCVGEDDHLRFSTLGDHDRVRWQLALTETRECDKIRWLYPGDSLTVTANKSRRRLGADRLTLGGSTVGPGIGTVQVVLRADGEDFVNDLVEMSAFGKGDVVWELNRRIPRETMKIELQLSSEEDAPFFLLHVANLEQSRPFETFDEDLLPSWQLVTAQ